MLNKISYVNKDEENEWMELIRYLEFVCQYSGTIFQQHHV